MGSLNITWGELQHLQEIDETLETVWKAVEGKTVHGCCWLLQKGWPTVQALGAQRRGRSDGCGPDRSTEEVPNTVLHIAHTIPSAIIYLKCNTHPRNDNVLYQ